MKDRTYADVVRSVARDGLRRDHVRTGEEVFETFGERVRLRLRAGLPLPGLRRVSPQVAAAELAWCVLGEERVGVLRDLGAEIWTDFAGADGRVDGAYGLRWRRHFGRDQLRGAVEELRVDPTSRQALVCAWDPGADGLVSAGMGERRPNVPCPFAFTAHDLAAAGVCIAVSVRSSDVMVGLPYDVMMYGLLLDVVASSLGRPRGVLLLNLANAHVYGRHLAAAEQMLKLGERAGVMPLPGWSLDAVEADPSGYVAAVASLARDARRPRHAEKLKAVL